MNEIANKLDTTARKLVADGVAKFKRHLCDSVTAILLAAQQYVSDLNRFPALAAKMYKDEFPNVSSMSWSLLRRIGNGDLTPTAFFQQTPTISAVGKLPYNVQVILLGDEKTSAVPQNVWDGKKVTSKLVADMSSTEVRRLIDSDEGKLRSIELQKTFVPSRSSADGAFIDTTSPYKIVGRTVVFKKAPLEVGVKELRAILDKLERS